MWLSVISRRTSLSFPHFRASYNVILVLFHVTDIVCFYVKTIFVFQNMEHKQTNKQTNKQANKSFSCSLLFSCSRLLFNKERDDVNQDLAN